MSIPQDLSEYLYNLIAPTHLEDCKVLVIEDIASFDWKAHEDASAHGLILVSPPGGDPSPWMEDIWRILKPGAHVLLISSEDQPTGHTGACVMEDRGFEVRDAILWVREAGRIHYVPKPAQLERHAGCENLNLRARKEEETPADADLDGMDSELLDGVEETDEVEEPEEIEEEKGPSQEALNKKGNVHPTVKARDLMARLLSDVPEGATVLDPFMGSGSTGLACLDTKHNFIGIDMEPDYVRIADARIRHWDRGRVGDGATIESEAPKPEEESQEEGSLDDFFGV
jgi:DNA modification methylase